MLSIIR